ncbi:MAG: hypothetical protein ACJ72N_10500 [Labedaea sp.]
MPIFGRAAGLRGRVSSHWLASAIALAYLIATSTLGVVLLSAPEQPVAAPAGNAYDARTGATAGADSGASTGAPATTAPPSTSGPAGSRVPTGPAGAARTSTRAAPPAPLPVTAPPGFRRVTGPAGVRTVIPAGWSSVRTTGPGAVQATDPAGTGGFVKYGGSAAPGVGIDLTHVKYENDFATRAAEYSRIVLRSARYGGHDAVEWEFEHRDGPQVAHVKSIYWRAEGKEYFLLASAPATQWPQMKSVYDTMVANADP